MRQFMAILVLFVGTLAWGEVKTTPRMIVIGQSLRVSVDERVKELVVIGGRVDVYGVVEKAVLVGGYIRLHPQAQITEELKMFGGHLEELEGAELMAEVIRMGIPLNEKNWQEAWEGVASSSVVRWFGSFWAKLSYFCFKLFVLLCCMALVNHVAPNYQNQVYQSLRERLSTHLFWGILSVLLVLPVTVFLTLSIIGIPLLPIQFSLLCVFVVLGNAHIARVLIEKLSMQFKIDLGLGRWSTIVVGLILMDALQFIPVVGTLVRFLLLVTGFGAASKTFYRMVLSKKSEALV